MKLRLLAASCLLLLPVLACEDRVPFYGTPSQEPVAGDDQGPAGHLRPPAEVAGPASTREKPQPIIVERRAVRESVVTAPAVRELPGGNVTLNFINASLPEVAQAVLGNILKVPYVLDPKVGGEVTLETSGPIPREALLATFESVLRVNGAALVREADLYKVVPLDEAAKSSPPVVTARAGLPGLPGYRVQVVPLEHVGAAEMQAILEPLAPAGGMLRADPARNILVLAGTRQELKAMLDLVDVFDVDWLRDKSFGIFPVEYADSPTMVAELEHVLGTELGLDISSVLRVVSLDRMNAVLAIASTTDYVELIGEWIGRLDRSWNQNDQRIFVYPVQNAKAADLAAIIGDLFGSGGGELTKRTASVAPRLERSRIGRDRPGLGGLSPSFSGATGGLTGRTSSLASRRPAAAAAEAVGTPAATAGTTSAAPAPEVRFSPEGGGATAPGIRGSGVLSEFVGLRVIPDEANNALVILATPGQYRTVEQTLRRLDVVPLQVLIEATIAEVTLNDDLRYGVQWFFEAGGTNQFSLRTIANSTGPGLASSGFTYFFSNGSGDLRAALDLLADVSDVKVISSPHLMVLGNQTAYLQVGDQVPVLTRTATSAINLDTVVSEIEYRDTGVILTVTPRVNPGGLVTLEIEQEASSVAQTTTGSSDSPTIQQRRISSTVAVQSGESIALGGLIRDDVTKARTGIPLLSEIPVLGILFGRTTDLQGRTELIIVLTPRVVASSPEAAAVTQELRARMKGLQKWDKLQF